MLEFHVSEAYKLPDLSLLHSLLKNLMTKFLKEIFNFEKTKRKNSLKKHHLSVAQKKNISNN